MAQMLNEEKIIMKEQAGEKYLTWWYNSKIWKNTQYRGIRTLKFPVDMWNYQELIFANDIEWVIETGTRHGGSAVYFADLLAMKNGGKVITVDVDVPSIHPLTFSHSRIEVVIGSSTHPIILKKMFSFLPEERGRVLLILDSNHQEHHVRKELDLYVPLLRSDDYLIVEDTLLDHEGARVGIHKGEGPLEAIQGFLVANPGILRRDLTRENKYGATVAPHGYYIKN